MSVIRFVPYLHIGEILSDYSRIESANEIHVRHKEIIIINQSAKISSRRNTGRPVDNCDRFARILSKVILQVGVKC